MKICNPVSSCWLRAIALIVVSTLSVFFVLQQMNKLSECPLSVGEEKHPVGLSLNATQVTAVSNKQQQDQSSKKVSLPPETVSPTHASPSVQQENNSNNKPTLFFHVGPRKTGTTTIQAILGDKKFSELLKQDNIAAVTNCKWYHIKDVYHCLIDPQCSDDDESLRFFKESVDKHYLPDPSRMVVHSAETFSYFQPNHNRTTEFMRSFQEKWNVRVIVTYRPLLSWLVSEYKQNRRHNLWDQKSGFRPYSDAELGERKTFPRFFAGRYQTGKPPEKDYVFTHGVYTQLFGNDAVMQLDMMAPQGLSEEFLCRGINATAACKYQQTLSELRTNDNSFAHPDIDLLVLHAHQMGLIRGKEFVGRHDATLILEKKMQENNLTKEDLPRACLDEKQMEILWNRVSQEEEIVPFKSHVEEVKPKHLPSLCSADPSSTLANETLRTLLFSPSSYQLEK